LVVPLLLVVVVDMVPYDIQIFLYGIAKSTHILTHFLSVHWLIAHWLEIPRNGSLKN